MTQQILDELKKMIKEHLWNDKFLLSETTPFALQKTLAKVEPTKRGINYIEPVEPKSAEYNAHIVQSLVELNSARGKMQNLVEKFSVIALKQLGGSIQLNELEVIIKKSMQIALTQILSELKTKE